MAPQGFNKQVEIFLPPSPFCSHSSNGYEQSKDLVAVQGKAPGNTPAKRCPTLSKTNIAEQIYHGLDAPKAVYLNPPSFGQEATNSSSPLGLNGGTNASVCSPGKSSSSVGVQRPSTKPSSQLQFVHYDRGKSQRTSENKGKRIAKSHNRERKAHVVTSRSEVLQNDAAPKRMVKTDPRGKVNGTMTVHGLNQVLRQPMPPELRHATSITRSVGACLRCRKNKFRCDMPKNDYEPCGQCMKLLANALKKRAETFQVQPCIRVNLLDLRLHRRGPTIEDGLHDWVKRKQKLLQAQKLDTTHLLFLTQGFGEGFENALSLKVSRFEPGPGDKTAYFWTDSSGKPRSMDMPPYFISDMEAARQSVRDFIHHSRPAYIEALLGDSNPIIRRTFEAALVYSGFEERTLISNVLDTWVASRLIESHWRVFNGGALLGIEPTNEPGHPYDGFIPVTPIMDKQLDGLIIREFIGPSINSFLKTIKQKIDERKRENWMEIYLAMFVMMSNVGWIIKDMIAMTTWKGLKAGNRGGTLTQGYIHACKTMLSHFHFACAGQVPLSLTFDNGNRREGNHDMTLDQIDFIQFMQQEILRQETKLSKWEELSMYKDDGYWCYQMLSQNWRGDIPHAGEIDDFREEDFLSSSTT